MIKTSLKILIAMLFSINCITAFSAEKITLTTQDWAPYQIYNKGLLSGYAVDVVSCALKKMNQPYDIEVYPWRRAQRIVEMDMADGFFTASQNKARDKFATISTVVAEQRWNWYLLKENSINPSDASFKQQAKVGAMLGSNMYSWLKSSGYKLIGSSLTTEALISDLLEKRYDAVLANELVAKNVMKELDLFNDQLQVHKYKNKPLGVYWSNKFLAKRPKFLSKFNTAVKNCR